MKMLLLSTLSLSLGILSTTVLGRPGEDVKSLHNLDLGFQFSFAQVTTRDGNILTGQIIGVYNQAKFMWNPTEFSTVVLFSCSDPTQPLSRFSTSPGSNPGLFSVNSKTISSIKVIEKPGDLVEYRGYMRNQGYLIQQVPIEGEAYVLEAWTTYHTWEDGRSNYAWDLAKLNANLMTYSNFGHSLKEFTVFGTKVYMPVEGKVITVIRKEVDNAPNLTGAVDLMDHETGEGIDLDEKPQNMIEIEMGGDGSAAMLRLLHFKEDTIPQDIEVGSVYPVGTEVGEVGNSGTTFVPHLHIVFGFTDTNNRFWALPIEWSSVEHRILMPYPHGYEYGQYHPHEYVYPKLGQCVKSIYNIL